MATNSSEHLGLHLWEPNDQVLRTEFNQNWQKIDTAVNAAAELPYVIGTYTGNGSNDKRTISLGFRPSFVLVSGLRSATRDDHDTLNRIAIWAGPFSHGMVNATETGFTVQTDGSTIEQWPKLNESGYQYYYIAFK